MKIFSLVAFEFIYLPTLVLSEIISIFPLVIYIIINRSLGSFRGYPLKPLIKHECIFNIAGIFFTRGLSDFIIYSSKESPKIFHHKKSLKIGTNFISSGIYSIIDFVIVLPSIKHLFSVIVEQRELDFTLLFVNINIFCGIASIYGLMKSGIRMKNNTKSWFDDHISGNVFVGFIVFSYSLYELFFLQKYLNIYVILSIACLFIPFLIILVLTGICFSFFFSCILFFVEHFTILSKD